MFSQIDQMCITSIQKLILLCLASTIVTSCLNELDDRSCEQIQSAGQKLSREIKKVNKLIQTVLLRSGEENLRIIKSVVEPLKVRLGAIKITNPKQTPIESVAFDSAKKELLNILRTTVQEENKKFWDLIIQTSTLLLQDKTVALAILTYPASRKEISARKPIYFNPTILSLNGVIAGISPKLEAMLLSVDVELKAASKKLVDMFIFSLKELLKDQLQLNCDMVHTNLNKYSDESMKVLVESVLYEGISRLKSCVRLVQIINGLVAGVKRVPSQLDSSISPARSLVLEALEETQTDENYEPVAIALSRSVQTIKNYYVELKTAVTS